METRAAISKDMVERLERYESKYDVLTFFIGLLKTFVSLLLIFIPALLVMMPGFPRSPLLAAVVFCICMASFILLSLGKYDIWCVLIVGSLTLLPAEAVGIISGYNYTLSSGLINISLAGYVSLTMFLHMLVFAAQRRIRIDTELLSWVIIFLVVFFTTRILANGVDGILSNRMLDSFIMPMLLAVAMRSIKGIDAKKVLSYFLAFLAIDAAYSCIELFMARNMFLDTYWSKSNLWYQQILGSHAYGVTYRSSALIGHPLTLALYMNLGFVLANRLINNKGYRFLLSILFFAAVFSTNSRAGLIIFLALFIYFSMKRGTLIFVASMVALLGAIAVFGPNLYGLFASRDANGASLLARIDGLVAFLGASPVDMIIGFGFRNSQSIVAAYSNSMNNMEIGPLLLIFQIGIIPFSLLIAYMLKVGRLGELHKQKKRNPTSVTILLMLAVFAIECCTYNSIGDPGQLMYLLFFLLSLIGCSCVESHKTRGGYER